MADQSSSGFSTVSPVIRRTEIQPASSIHELPAPTPRFPDVQAPIRAFQDPSTPTRILCDDGLRSSPIRHDHTGRVGDRVANVDTAQPLEHGSVPEGSKSPHPSSLSQPVGTSMGPLEVSGTPRDSISASVVRTIPLEHGQQASVIVENGRISRIVTSNGQVAELRWKHKPSPDHPAKPPVRVRMRAAPSPGGSPVHSPSVTASPSASHAAARLASVRAATCVLTPSARAHTLSEAPGSPCSPDRRKLAEAALRRVHSVEMEPYSLRNTPHSPEYPPLALLCAASPTQDWAATRQHRARGLAGAGQPEAATQDPYLTAHETSDSRELGELVPAAHTPSEPAPNHSTFAYPSPARTSLPFSSSDGLRLSAMLRSHAVELSPGLEWTETGSSSIENSPGLLHQKSLSFPGYQGDQRSGGTLETEASLYSATSSIPSPFSSPMQPPPQQLSTNTSHAEVATWMEPVRQPLKHVTAADGSVLGHERTTSLRLLFEGGGPLPDATREASATAVPGRPESPSVRQRIQELAAAAAAAKDRPAAPSFSNLRPGPRTEPGRPMHAAAQGSHAGREAGQEEAVLSEAHGPNVGGTGPQAEVAPPLGDPEGLRRVDSHGLPVGAHPSRSHSGGFPGDPGLPHGNLGSRHAPVPSCPSASHPLYEEPRGSDGPGSASAGAAGPGGNGPSAGRALPAGPREVVAFLEAFEREVGARPSPWDVAPRVQPEPGALISVQRPPVPPSSTKEAASSTSQGTQQSAPWSLAGAAPMSYGPPEARETQAGSCAGAEYAPGALQRPARESSGRSQAGYSPRYPGEPNPISGLPSRLRPSSALADASQPAAEPGQLQSAGVGQAMSAGTPAEGPETSSARGSPFAMRASGPSSTQDSTAPVGLTVSLMQGGISQAPPLPVGETGARSASASNSGRVSQEGAAGGQDYDAEAWAGLSGVAALALEAAPGQGTGASEPLRKLSLQVPVEPGTDPSSLPFATTGPPVPQAGATLPPSSRSSPLPGQWTQEQQAAMGSALDKVGKKEGFLKRIKRALKPSSKGHGGNPSETSLTSGASSLAPSRSPSTTGGPLLAEGGTMRSPGRLRTATMPGPLPSPSMLLPAMSTGTPRRSPRLSLDVRSSPRVPHGLRGPAGWPPLSSVTYQDTVAKPPPSTSPAPEGQGGLAHSTDVGQEQAMGLATTSSAPMPRLDPMSRPHKGSSKEEEPSWEAGPEGGRGALGDPSTPSRGSEPQAVLVTGDGSTGASRSSASSEVPPPALSRFAFSQEENAAWARVWKRQVERAPQYAAMLEGAMSGRTSRTLSAEDIEALLRLEALDEGLLRAHDVPQPALPSPPQDRPESAEPSGGWDESQEAGSIGDSKEVMSRRRSKKREPGFVSPILVPPPSRTGMAGKWRKSLTEGSSGEAVDELLDMSTLQRLARQRIVEMELVETDEVFEIVWHIPLNANASKITKVERYMKDGTIVEGLRRDGRPGTLRSQLTFSQDGTPHIRSVQGEPYAAAFHDRIRMSTGRHRLKLEQKFNLLGSHAAPVKHYSIWQRIDE